MLGQQRSEGLRRRVLGQQPRWQGIFFGNKSEFRDLGVLTQMRGSIRSQIDRLTEAEALKAVVRNKGRLVAAASAYAAQVAQPSEKRAEALTEDVERVIAEVGGDAGGADAAKRRRKGREATAEPEEPDISALHRRRPPRPGRRAD